MLAADHQLWETCGTRRGRVSHDPDRAETAVAANAAQGHGRALPGRCQPADHRVAVAEQDDPYTAQRRFDVEVER